MYIFDNDTYFRQTDVSKSMITIALLTLTIM